MSLSDLLYTLTGAVVLVFALIVSVAVHECGHVLAGALQGWRCVGFGFGLELFARLETARHQVGSKRP